MGILDKFKIGYWNIGIIEHPISDIMEHKPFMIKWLKHRYKDRFFADPFIYKEDERYYYILAEELIFTEDKGTIVLLKIDRNTMKLVQRQMIINDKYHLSYPNYNNKTIIPENHKSGNLYAFHFDGDKVEKELISNIPLIDPTFVQYQEKLWLFGTTKESFDDPNKKLSIFYKKGGCFVPHKRNPVKIDINSARPGGNFFWYQGELFRPAQNCEHLYGEDIRIMKVKQLDEENYIEELHTIISSHDSERYNEGLHTFNVYNGFIVVDGFEHSIQIRQKIRNKFVKL